jgi:hypothetical protein
VSRYCNRLKFIINNGISEGMFQLLLLLQQNSVNEMPKVPIIVLQESRMIGIIIKVS